MKMCNQDLSRLRYKRPGHVPLFSERAASKRTILSVHRHRCTTILASAVPLYDSAPREEPRFSALAQHAFRKPEEGLTALDGTEHS